MSQWFIVSDSFLACEFKMAHPAAGESNTLRKLFFFGANGVVTELKCFSYINMRIAQSVLKTLNSRIALYLPECLTFHSKLPRPLKIGDAQ